MAGTLVVPGFAGGVVLNTSSDSQAVDELQRADGCERFWSKVDKSGDCWIWKAGRGGHGYGIFKVAAYRSAYAHRVAWELTNGPIPPTEGYHGTCVLHRCDNPACVNPSHLFLGTAADNAADREAKGRLPHTPRTHCFRGHELSPENTLVQRNSRTCRTCRKASDRDRRISEKGRAST